MNALRALRPVRSRCRSAASCSTARRCSCRSSARSDHGVEFVGILALFDRFGQIRGWTLPEVALFYGMIRSRSRVRCIGRGFDVFGVRSSRPATSTACCCARAGRCCSCSATSSPCGASAGCCRAWSCSAGPCPARSTGSRRGSRCSRHARRDVSVLLGLVVLRRDDRVLDDGVARDLERVHLRRRRDRAVPDGHLPTRFRRFFTFVVPLAR